MYSSPEGNMTRRCSSVSRRCTLPAHDANSLYIELTDSLFSDLCLNTVLVPQVPLSFLDILRSSEKLPGAWTHRPNLLVR